MKSGSKPATVGAVLGLLSLSSSAGSIPGSACAFDGFRRAAPHSSFPVAALPTEGARRSPALDEALLEDCRLEDVVPLSLVVGNVKRGL